MDWEHTKELWNIYLLSKTENKFWLPRFTYNALQRWHYFSSVHTYILPALKKILTGLITLCLRHISSSFSLSAYRINHSYTQQLKPPPSEPHMITTQQTYTRLRKTTKTNEHIVPHTINMPEFNTAYCYSTIPHMAITPHSRQLLIMGMGLPKTCWAVYKEK